MSIEAPVRSRRLNYVIIGVLVVAALIGAVLLANRNASESDVLGGTTNGRDWKVIEDDGCLKLVAGTEVVSGACNFEQSILEVESRAVTLPDGTVVVYGAAVPGVKEITVTGGGNSQTIEPEGRDGWDKHPFAVQVPGAVEGVYADGKPVAMPERGA